MPVARAKQASVVVALLLTAAVLSSAQIINEHNPVCNGVFDFYFVLDTSGSIADSFHSEIVPFVENVTDHFIEPDFRVAFVTFASSSVVLLNLTRTGDREEVQAGIERLKMFEPDGATYLAPGLSEVNDQISQLGGDAVSVILALTDGKLGDLSEALQQADIARSRGANVFTVGVDEIDEDQLTQIAGNKKRVYIGSDFQYLSQIIDNVVNETCVEIGSVSPSMACIGTSQNITLRGRGFTNQLVPDQAACRFMTRDGEVYLTKPGGEITYNVISCPTPAFNGTDDLLLQVTLNGITFISSNVSMKISTCEPADVGYIAGVFMGLLAVILLVFLVLLWFFCPLITGKVVGGLPQEKKKPPRPRPPPGKGTPGKKWEVVDASYYGGRGAGGISPMTVRWGDKGATEEGNKLEKAKDATVVKVQRQPGRPAPPRPNAPAPYVKSTGCCDSFKAKIARWYAVAASYRPVYTVHGSAREILWSRHAQSQAKKKSPTPV